MTATVCVVGSFMIDLVSRTHRRPGAGETVVGTSFATFLGGKGYNQAVAARRAGADVSFVGRVGADAYGDAFREGLRAEGIDATHVVSDPDVGTGVGLPVIDDEGQNAIVIVPRANWSVTVEDVEAAHRAIAQADVLLLQLELPMAVVVAAAQLAHDAGTTVVLNPAPYDPVPAELLKLVDVLVPNETEAQALAGLPGTTGDVVRRLADQRRGRLVVTLGDAGVVVCDDDGQLYAVDACPVAETVDTVGAGDVFCGVLGTCLANGDTLITAAETANAAAAIAVTRTGSADAAPRADEIATAPRRRAAHIDLAASTWAR